MSAAPAGTVPPEYVVADAPPYCCMTAGPPVIVSVVEAIAAGIGGIVALTCAAAARALASSNWNVAFASLITAKRSTDGTPAGSDAGESGGKAASAAAALALATACGAGFTNHASVPHLDGAGMPHSWLGATRTVGTC